MNWVAIGQFWLIVGGAFGLAILGVWWQYWVTKDTGWLYDNKRTAISVLVLLTVVSVVIGVIA